MRKEEGRGLVSMEKLVHTEIQFFRKKNRKTANNINSKNHTRINRKRELLNYEKKKKKIEKKSNCANTSESNVRKLRTE